MNHPRTWTRIPPESVLQSVLEVYESGRTLDALKRATDFAPLKDWDGTRGCSLAGRIAMNAGGTRLASRLAVRSWRADKTHPLAQFDYGFQLFLRRGPLAFQVRAKSWPPVTGDKATWQADVVALKATAATELRDLRPPKNCWARRSCSRPGARGRGCNAPNSWRGRAGQRRRSNSPWRPANCIRIAIIVLGCRS